MFGGKPGVLELVIILAIVILVFGGRGKISSIMGDLGSGLKAFRKSVKDDEKDEAEETKQAVEASSLENDEEKK